MNVRTLFAAAIIILFPVLGYAQAEVIAVFDPARAEYPEGVAADKCGNVFVSLTELGEVHKISPDGTRTLFAVLDHRVFGLTVDRSGNVYAVVNSDKVESHGAWRISADQT